MITIRPMEARDIPGALQLQRCCFPDPFPADLLWSADHLRRHLAIFPEGQFVAEVGGRVVGSSSSAMISEDSWLGHRPWEETLGGFMFENHDPRGTTLYGADISVHPEHQGKGIGRGLYSVRFEFVKAKPLRRFGTACRLPGCAAWVHGTGRSVNDYVRSVSSGEVADRTLTPLLRYGLSILDVLEEYMDDEESLNCAALLEWIPS